MASPVGDQLLGISAGRIFLQSLEEMAFTTRTKDHSSEILTTPILRTEP